MKTGYRQDVSAEYEFMKKYPPLHRDTAVKRKEFKPHHIPYIKLYEKAVTRNPVMLSLGPFVSFFVVCVLCITAHKYIVF